MRNDRHRALGLLTAGALLAGLAACGGGDGGPGTPSPPPPTPVPCTQTTIKQETGGISARTIVFDDFSVPDTGRLDVTLDWTVASSSIGFYLVPANTCTSATEFNNRTCNFLVRSEPPGTKPRKISTPNFAAGNYRWLIANFADIQESVSMQIVLSKGGCPALTGGSPGASSETAESQPKLERMNRR